MKSGKLRFWVVVAVLAVQCVAVGWLVWRYERTVREGTEVRFKCRAYDPSDPLRGRYLRLNVREQTENIPQGVTNINWQLRNKFFVRIEPSTNRLWRVAEADFAPSSEGIWVRPKRSRIDWRLGWPERGNNESWPAFRERQKVSGVVVTAEFPNQLFLNEKLAPKAEAYLRQWNDGAVAVYRVYDGEMVLTDVEVDGKSIFEQVQRDCGRAGAKR